MARCSSQWSVAHDKSCHWSGNIAASIDRCEAAADNKDDYRNTGLYRLFPDGEFMATSAWAWATHRAVDALLMIGAGEVGDSRGGKATPIGGIAITGHSRGGKAAMLAGATDERITVTNPNNSGGERWPTIPPV